jgi:hypothetical protein
MTTGFWVGTLLTGEHSMKTLIGILGIAVLLSGCGGLVVAQRNQVAGIVGTLLGAQSPSTELVQTYYLGVFDPQDQLPPAIYRVRVRGQASALSFTKYASGWVPAAVIDSLTDGYQTTNAGRGKLERIQATDTEQTQLDVGRRLMLFGPEGFREAPRNHRLAIVMGSSPDEFFNSVSEALGTVAQAKVGASTANFNGLLSSILLELKSDAELYTAIGEK